MEKKDFLSIRRLKKYFPVKSGFWGRSLKWVHAVDSVDLEMARGEVLGIVGESGCGKSTLAQVIAGVYPPSSGTVELEGIDVVKSHRTRDLSLKRNIQIVFQDPFWSLNPRKMVRDIVAEPLVVHKMIKGNAITKIVADLMTLVGLSSERMFSYPHEFSAGERQRVAIARAISLKPALVILDEPTSSIDTLSQAETMNVLLKLKRELGLSYMIISHDLSVIQFMSDRIAVMYLGKLMEIGLVSDVFGSVCHPYTKALMKALPVIDIHGRVKELVPLGGEIPSAINPPSGCRFHARCPECQEICKLEEPRLKRIDGNHLIACHFVDGR